MSATIRELLGSRPASTTQGATKATRRFSVWDDSTPITNPYTIYALFGTGGLPIYGELFPLWPTMAAYDVTVEPYEGQSDTWQVEWSYTDTPDIPGGGNPLDVGYVELSAKVTGEWIDSWRAVTISGIASLVASGGLYPFGSPASNPGSDIGGTALDTSGVPVSFMKRQISLNVGVTMSAKPNLAIAYQFLTRRNNTYFGGAPPGSALCTGASFDRIELHKWRMTYEFLVDQWYHMVQAPDVFGDQSDNLDTTTALPAKIVRFRQPFLDFGNFYAIDPHFAGNI